MTYKIALETWGAECSAGMIPDHILKYIQDECEGDIDIYKEKLDDEEVPEDYKLFEDMSAGYDGWKTFFNEYSVYPNCRMTVTDENDKEVCVVDDVFNDDSIAKDYDETTAPKGYVYVWKSVEKGYFTCEIETDDEVFDKSKLTAHILSLTINGEYVYRNICQMSYGDSDGEDVVCQNSRGISYELDLYEVKE